MEELIALTKKQLLFQKIISACLVFLVIIMLAAGGMAVNCINRMTTAMEDAVVKLEEIDIEGINETISGTQEMMESVDEFSSAVDSVTGKVQEFDDWVGSLFSR